MENLRVSALATTTGHSNEVKMKRSLVKFDAFKKIEDQSATNAEFELAEAESLLAQALGLEDLKLHCFNEASATYKTLDDTYVHAGYTLKDNQLKFENIEELVIDEETEKAESKKLLYDMVEALFEDNQDKASEKLHDYLAMPVVRRQMLGETFKVTVSKPTGKHSKLYHKKQSRSLVAKRIRAMKRTKAKYKANSSLQHNIDNRKKIAQTKLAGTSNPRWRVYVRKVKPKTMKEWSSLCNNVIDYINYREVGPVLKESELHTDEKGNVNALSIPVSVVRNEFALKDMDVSVWDYQVKSQRAEAKKLSENQAFCKAMAELKRFKAISDDSLLQTTMESIVTTWPNVLYLTQPELAETISESLKNANIVNYDDQMCNFMAEGVLRTVHNFYTDRVEKLSKLAGVKTESEDVYAEFQNGMSTFYAAMDEADKAELKMFSDLYEALREFHGHASTVGDEATQGELEDYLDECEEILNRKSQPDLELAETIVLLLSDLLETNLTMSDWEPSSVHITQDGNHPVTFEKAKKSYSPDSDFSGDWGDVAPVSDGTPNYKSNGQASDMRNNSWGNKNGSQTNIPPAAGEFTMKGEVGADKATDGFGDYKAAGMYPNITNPYVPQAVMPKPVE